MSRRNWKLIALAVLLGAISLYLNKDWFAKGNIQISHRSRPMRATFFRHRRPVDSEVNPIVFLLNQSLKLTSIKVIPLSDIQTNAHPHAIWHLVSDSNSVPTKSFFYGYPIRGMRPEVKGATPDPLEPGVPYRLLVEAGKLKAEHDFTPDPVTP